MAALFFLVLFVLIAAASPFLGSDSRDTMRESYRDERGWYPAGPDARPQPRY